MYYLVLSWYLFSFPSFTSIFCLVSSSFILGSSWRAFSVSSEYISMFRFRIFLVVVVFLSVSLVWVLTWVLTFCLQGGPRYHNRLIFLLHILNHYNNHYHSDFFNHYHCDSYRNRAYFHLSQIFNSVARFSYLTSFFSFNFTLWYAGQTKWTSSFFLINEN